MATTRSKTLGCGSESSWMRILRLSMAPSLAAIRASGGRQPLFRRCAPLRAQRRNRGLTPPARQLRGGLLRRERVLGGVLLRGDLGRGRQALHRVGDGHLGGVVVVLV